MIHLSRRAWLTGAGAAALLPVGALHAAAPPVSVGNDGVALSGFDTTGYWRTGAPVRGAATFNQTWHGVPWHFASEVDAATFAASPQKYAPQFGGFCTRAMSFKKVVDSDPTVWRIYQDKLYLFARPVGGEKFDEGQDAMIAKAQAHWQSLVS